MLMSARRTLITVTHTPPASTQLDTTSAPAGPAGPAMESDVLVRFNPHLPCYWARKVCKLNVAITIIHFFCNALYIKQKLKVLQI